VSERLYSIPEAAEVKGVSRTAIALAVKEGRIPATRVGRAWVIRESDLEGYTPNKNKRRKLRRRVRRPKGGV